MNALSYLDWSIIAGYMIFAIGIGIYFSKRASKNMSEYFVSGRNLPWWIIGTSMVATTFAADTPLAITGMVAKNGIAGNWFWWNLAASHALAVFFFARLWRRANILTDIELIELRYSGKPAAFLRGFRSLWEGIFLNAIVMGWVILAMTKIIDALFDLSTWNSITFFGIVLDPKWQAITFCLLISFIYCVLSGFWGVVVTDLVQFVIAIFGSITLAIISVSKAGGMTNVITKLEAQTGNKNILSLIPEVGGTMMPFVTFIAFITVNWWAARTADGGGYIAQRMFAAKNERHSLWGTLWFAVAHYALRPWPWIIVALVSFVVLPTNIHPKLLEDPELRYPLMVLKYLPTGLKGLMIASFLAAFMSTIDTQLNWGSSLLINDFYKRFIKKDASEKHYVLASRLAVTFLIIVGAIFAYSMKSVGGAWKFMYAMTAGIGGVYIARWFWWRVNAFSEITAWISSAIAYYFVVKHWKVEIYGWKLIYTAGISTTCWVIATLLTKPSEESKLIEFFRRVKPGSPFWKPIADKLPDVEVKHIGWIDFALWFSCIIFIYTTLFSIGKFILQSYFHGTILGVIALISGAFIFMNSGKQEK